VLSFLFFVHRLIFLSLDSLVVRLGILIHQLFSFTLRLTRCSSRILTGYGPWLLSQPFSFTRSPTSDIVVCQFYSHLIQFEPSRDCHFPLRPSFLKHKNFLGCREFFTLPCRTRKLYARPFYHLTTSRHSSRGYSRASVIKPTIFSSESCSLGDRIRASLIGFYYPLHRLHPHSLHSYSSRRSFFATSFVLSYPSYGFGVIYVLATGVAPESFVLVLASFALSIVTCVLAIISFIPSCM